MRSQLGHRALLYFADLPKIHARPTRLGRGTARELNVESAIWSTLGGTIKKIKYAHAVFFEVLRLHPPVPLDQKYALKDDVWPDGTQIKKGDVIGWCAYAQGRLEDLWGPNCLDFYPERWIVNGELRKVSQGQWPIFHGGPRLCLGKSMAILEALVALSFLLKQYRFALVPGQDITYMRALTLPMENGMMVQVQRRNL